MTTILGKKRRGWANLKQMQATIFRQAKREMSHGLLMEASKEKHMPEGLLGRFSGCGRKGSVFPLALKVLGQWVAHPLPWTVLLEPYFICVGLEDFETLPLCFHTWNENPTLCGRGRKRQPGRPMSIPLSFSFPSSWCSSTFPFLLFFFSCLSANFLKNYKYHLK